MKKIVNIALLLFFLCSCKKTEVTGIVYSKHNIPVPNVDVKIYWNIGGDTKPEGTISTTDNQGRYNLSFKSKSGRAYTVSCESDSGKIWEPVKEKQTNNIDLYLK